VTKPDHVRDGDAPTFRAPPDWRPLDGLATGWQVWYVDETGSTNTDLLVACDAGAADRSVLIAGHQTAGRGRLDRHWEAPPGTNLLVSMLFRVVPDSPAALTQRIGLAAVAAARRVRPDVHVGLKWPNDVLLGGRKLAGILAQRATSGPVVVGLGLNVGWAPDDAACLGGGIAARELLADVLAAYDDLPADVAAPYRASLDTLGAAVRVELPNETFEGRAVDAVDVVHLRLTE
jgi:BirA family transcriptional regulator, biotin operon repressor / biotin---[acetyl-CoA-carboxylase] ligase